MTSHSRKLAFVVALLATAAFAQPAMAAGSTCQAPPGTSAIDQYCEALPSPGGNGSNHHKPSHHVSNSTSKALSQQGAAGQAVLDFANSSGAASTKHKAHRHSKRHAASPKPHVGKVAPTADHLPAPGSNPLSAVGSAVDTGVSTGAALLWLLVAIAVVMGLTAYIGRRRRSSEG